MTSDDRLSPSSTQDNIRVPSRDKVAESTSSVKRNESAAKTRPPVRLVVISDTHGHHELLPPLPTGDLLIHCGDFCNRGRIGHVRSFAKWFAGQTCCPEKIVVAGNHDRVVKYPDKINLEKEFAKVGGDVRVLFDETVKRAGLRIHGASWESCEIDDFSQVGHGVDLLLAHVNPHIPRDVIKGKNNNMSSSRGWRGSRALSEAVLEKHIPLCCSGHVHASRGVVRFQRKSGGLSVFVNASSRKPSRMGPGVSAPVVIDYDPVERQVIVIHCPAHKE